MSKLELVKIALDIFDYELCERMNEVTKDIILEAIQNSVSPIIRIVNNGEEIIINRDDYGHDDIIRFIFQNMNDSTSVVIDGIDVLYWD